MTPKTHLGIYALIERSNRILLVKKTRGPYTGSWDLPGGRPDHGETIFQTLQREVLEETGIHLLSALPHSNHALLVPYLDATLHHICLIYTATDFDATHLRTAIHHEDVSTCAWHKKSELPNLPLSKVVQCVI